MIPSLPRVPLTLAGANSYSGLTTVGAGTLQIGSGEASTSLGASSFSVSSGATLVFNRNADDTKFTTQSIGGGGDVVFRGQQNGYFAFMIVSISAFGNWLLKAA